MSMFNTDRSSSRIALTFKTAWSRMTRPKRRDSLVVWPTTLTITLCLSILAIVLAGSFDGAILLHVRALNSGAVNFLADVTDAGKSHYYLIPALLVMLVAASLDWRKRGMAAQAMLMRAFERSAFIFFSIIVPGIGINIAKQIIGRGRPRTFDAEGAYAFSPFEFSHIYQSFPSGHSTTVGSLGMIVALYVPALRWPALIGFALLALSRVAASAHYISDVIAGFTIGALFTLVFARWLASRAIMFREDASTVFPSLLR